ncbi:MAG TPA: alanine--glyoxylate aminotransferase family protein [Acidobacteriota bacterium]|nr:alanine--glyoxylate aminotransferase family protein [Acidobacteriota bacterium]
MRKIRLFTPGPTPLSPEAQEALGRPIIHHRTPEYAELHKATVANLKKIFKTSNDLLLLSASGTGAMEAAVNNLLNASNHVLVVVAGKFGERWYELCEKFGVPATALCKEYGEAASVDEIRSKIKENPEIDALLLQGSETSTATSHDLRAIGNMLRSEFPEVISVVDGITSVACEWLETDEWGLDIVISGSQKAFAVPPGLSFLSVSPRTLEQMKANQAPRYYFDLPKEAEKQAEGKTAYTSSVSLTAALHATTESILQHGLKRVIGETAEMAHATREGLTRLGFKLLSQAPANACTAAYPPDGISGSDLARELHERFGLKVAGGQGRLKGRIIRIAHLGYFDQLDVFTVLGAIEVCLKEMGADIEVGSGVSAAIRASVREPMEALGGVHGAGEGPEA